jgi:hypothetical protein
MSVVKALEHASMRCGRKLELKVSYRRLGIKRRALTVVTFSGSTRRILSRMQRCRILCSTTMLGELSVLQSEIICCKQVPVSFAEISRNLRGIIVPGGFGLRGTEGMIAAIKWAREKKVPFLGICLGFQVACIEWARNVCGMEGKCLESMQRKDAY